MKRLTIPLLIIFLALCVHIEIARSDEIMVLLMPSPMGHFSGGPLYQFGDGTKGTRLPSKEADVYRYKFGFTPKEDGPFVVYSTADGIITAMMKKGHKKPESYNHVGLLIDDHGITKVDDGPTCWHCYEIEGKLHCFEVKCPFDISSGEDDKGSSVNPEILRTVVPTIPGSSPPPGSTIPPDSGRSTGTTTTDPGRTQDGSSSSSSSSIIRGEGR